MPRQFNLITTLCHYFKAQKIIFSWITLFMLSCLIQHAEARVSSSPEFTRRFRKHFFPMGSELFFCGLYVVSAICVIDFIISSLRKPFRVCWGRKNVRERRRKHFFLKPEVFDKLVPSQSSRAGFENIFFRWEVNYFFCGLYVVSTICVINFIISSLRKPFRVCWGGKMSEKEDGSISF